MSPARFRCATMLLVDDCSRPTQNKLLKNYHVTTCDSSQQVKNPATIKFQALYHEWVHSVYILRLILEL